MIGHDKTLHGKETSINLKWKLGLGQPIWRQGSGLGQESLIKTFLKRRTCNTMFSGIATFTGPGANNK